MKLSTDTLQELLEDIRDRLEALEDRVEYLIDQGGPSHSSQSYDNHTDSDLD